MSRLIALLLFLCFCFAAVRSEAQFTYGLGGFLRRLGITEEPGTRPPFGSPEVTKKTSAKVDGRVEAPLAITVTAILRNKSSLEAHLFTEGEVPSTSSLFRPGETRSIAFPLPAKDQVTFCAVQDGKTIASHTWRGDPREPDRVPIVLFDDRNGIGSFTVVTGMKSR